MQRLESFDCLNQARLDLLRYLLEKELDLGEVVRFTKRGRSCTHHHLQVLVKAGLVTQKKALKKNWVSGKHSHREIIRYQLTGDGKAAVEYFSFAGGK